MLKISNLIPCVGDEFVIYNMFPVPVYETHRNLDLDSTEEKDLDDIIEEGLRKNAENSRSINDYVFNTKLKNIKEFCEEHIKKYVKEIINPVEELDIYITQSWVNVTKPGEGHQNHRHENSIISGAFYLRTDVGQTITCFNPRGMMNYNYQPTIHFEEKNTVWNSETFSYEVSSGQLLLFPSWLLHGVHANSQQTKEVISISFNTFVRGNLGAGVNLNQLILQ